jgi:hypothetical protein
LHSTLSCPAGGFAATTAGCTPGFVGHGLDYRSGYGWENCWRKRKKWRVKRGKGKRDKKNPRPEIRPGKKTSKSLKKIRI